MPGDSPPICNYEGSDYQTSFWEQGGRAYEDAAEGVALRRLLPASGKLMLELGAGAGRNTPRYAGFERVVLLDYSRTQLEQAQARLQGGGSERSERYIYVAADVYRLPFQPRIFDAATMIRTLHHMAEPRRALEQVRWALAPGAIFILEFANKQNLKAIARYALGRQAWSPFSPEPVEFAALNFDFQPAAVRTWLREAGFAVQRQLTVSHFRMELFKRLLPVSLLVRMDAFAQLTGDWWQLSPSVFVRARVDGAGQPAVQSSPAVAGAPQGVTNLFHCPVCGQAPLREQPEALICPACDRRWPCQGGIYDFRLEDGK